MTGYTTEEYLAALERLTEDVDNDYPPHGVPIRQMRRALHKKRLALAVRGAIGLMAAPKIMVSF